jgi:hypothetical protein
MIRQPFVFFFVSLKLLPLPVPDGAKNLFLFAVIVVNPLKYAQFFSGTDDPVVRGMDMTLTKRKIIDNIQQIGFTHPVITEKTIHFDGTNDFRLTNIFIIQNR